MYPGLAAGKVTLYPNQNKNIALLRCTWQSPEPLVVGVPGLIPFYHYKRIPSFPSNITRVYPHSLLISQGNTLIPFYTARGVGLRTTARRLMRRSSPPATSDGWCGLLKVATCFKVPQLYTLKSLRLIYINPEKPEVLQADD